MHLNSAAQARQVERAERLQSEANATYRTARDMAAVIPFGQPILVGHHSEGRDRNYRERIHNKFGKAFELDRQADEARARAESESSAISSDDPDAPEKLRERIAELEAKQARMVAINKAHAAFIKAPDAAKTVAMLAALSLPERQAVITYKPAYSWESHPVAPYQLTNNSGNLQRLKDRLAAMERNRAQPVSADIVGEGYTVREDAEENRLMIVFDAIPTAPTIAKAEAPARELLLSVGPLLFGRNWQRQTAEALGA